jgi:hypothetical protein
VMNVDCAYTAVEKEDFVLAVKPDVKKVRLQQTPKLERPSEHADDTSTQGLKVDVLAEGPDNADDAVKALEEDIQAKWTLRMGFDSPESPVRLLRSNSNCQVAEAAAELLHPDTLRRFPSVHLFAETLLPIGHSSRIHLLKSFQHKDQ